MATPSSHNDATISLNTILHMIPIKLTSSNYLVWKNQMTPLLSLQNLLSHVDGSATSPPPILFEGDKSIPNPLYSVWVTNDQKATVILNASLSEEAMAEVLGLHTAREIWVTLENAYSNTSIERVHNLRDQLRHLSKGTSTVADFGRKFKGVCDQLSAVGHPVDDSDKVHWFLCGLGSSFETFSTAVRTTKPSPSFRDLLIQAESHELFLRSNHGPPSSPVAFSVEHDKPTMSRGRGGRPYRGNSSGARGRGRRSPHCQLCRREGHYANQCPTLPNYTARPNSTDTELVKAFHVQCHVTNSGPDWFVDSGASDHMAASVDNLDKSTPYPGNNRVTFGNGPKHEAGSRSRSV